MHWRDSRPLPWEGLDRARQRSSRPSWSLNELVNLTAKRGSRKTIEKYSSVYAMCYSYVSAIFSCRPAWRRRKRSEVAQWGSCCEEAAVRKPGKTDPDSWRGSSRLLPRMVTVFCLLSLSDRRNVVETTLGWPVGVCDRLVAQETTTNIYGWHVALTVRKWSEFTHEWPINEDHKIVSIPRGSCVGWILTLQMSDPVRFDVLRAAELSAACHQINQINQINLDGQIICCTFL